MKALLLSLLVITSVSAKESFLDSVKREQWNLGKDRKLDVVWIEDDKFPKFTASIYFQDGALNDQYPGVAQTALDLLSSGTSNETQREISEFFDFYGANLRHSVTHEYSIFTVQALTKDIKPVVGKVCELFKHASYPDAEIKSHVSRTKSRLRNLVTSHAGLADRVFRQISLQGTPYEHPVDGTLKSLEAMTAKNLKERLISLNRAKKTLYLAGPSDVKEIKKVLADHCEWTNETSLNVQQLKKPEPQSAVYLVEVPNANQAQIRVGRYLINREFQDKYDHYHFLSGFLGGGFTSKLVQELRVKRGLTYSAGSYVSLQRDYGRAGIMTFSKNETTTEAISIIRDVFADISQGKFEEKEFLHQKGHQIGGYAFGFEETNAFLGQIMLYDHQGRDLEELVKFPENIGKMTMTELSSSNLQIFPWERQTIVVVGDKSLAKSLSKIRPVRIVKLEDYL